MVLDTNALTAVDALASPTDPATISNPGRLLNMSLQSVVSMRVGTLQSEMPRLAALTEPAQGPIQ